MMNCKLAPSILTPSDRRRSRSVSVAQGAGQRAVRGNVLARSGHQSSVTIAPAAGKLRMFLDSASVHAWHLYQHHGIFHGYTTNPTILERDGVKCTVRSLRDLTQTAFSLGAHEMQLQSWGETHVQLASTAVELAGAVDPRRVVIKLPCTSDGIRAAASLRKEGIRITMTGVYRSDQVLLAQAVGAEYAAPYLGRMNDQLGDGQGTKNVIEMQEMIRSLDSPLRLLVASLRDPSELAYLASKGCDTFTLSPAVAAKMFEVQSTIAAAADFEAAVKRGGGYGGDSWEGGDLQV